MKTAVQVGPIQRDRLAVSFSRPSRDHFYLYTEDVERLIALLFFRLPKDRQAEVLKVLR